MLAAATISVVVLAWFGARAILEWRRSAALLASRRAESAADLLVTSLTRDMRGVQTSILASTHQADPAEVYDLVGTAFARYPYPEAFFTAASASTDTMKFYLRSDRDPAWLPATAAHGRFPVVVDRAPDTARTLMARITIDAARGARYSIFETTFNASPYQVIALLTYDDRFHEHLVEVFGFMVNLDWARRHYFGDLARQVARSKRTGGEVTTAIADERGTAIVPAADGEVPDAASRRAFPLAFFDPILIATAPPADLPMRTWTAEAVIAGDAALRAANQGATRTLLLAGATALLLCVSLVLTLRAARASNALAEMRSEFVSTVTHELKTPIATIRAISESLASGRIDAPGTSREYAQMAVHETKRLTRLIDNLLAYSRVTDTTEVYSFEAIEPWEIVTATLHDFSSKLVEGRFEVQVSTPPELPRVRADRTAISLALANVVDNAIRYSADAREIHVTAARAGSRVVFEIADRGIGIPEGEIEQVTRKFFRGRKAASGGSGLGLAIVQRIVRDHGGALSIHSRVDEGTTVSIALPLAEPA
jgi:signal transduction histidine kinase